MTARGLEQSGPPDNPIAGRNVLVTGGTGAFGQAFVKRCLRDGARRVVVFARGEAKLAAMKASLNDDRVRYLVGDVRDRARLVVACRGVDIVVHAAALKRVEICEADPEEANATNIDGTANVAHAAIANRVARALFLSTDKAASPATHYGKTKAVAESTWNGMNVYAAGTGTRFSCTRYGNVIGSTGSVVPTWKAQAEHAKRIEVTEPTMTRFWMTMDAAVDLVMMALRDMRGGEIFVPRIGASSIGELAVAVAPGSTWTITGPRVGEKYHELLITEDEARRTYSAPDYFVVEPESRVWDDDIAPIPNAVPVGWGFTLRSDTAPTIPVEDLRTMVAA